MAKSLDLADWIIRNLLNEAQLGVIPPGETLALRFLAPSVQPRHRVEVVALQPTGRMKVIAFYPVDVSTLANCYAAAGARCERERATPGAAGSISVREVDAPE